MADTPNSFLRWLVRRDIDAVLGLEHECFDCPLEDEEILKCLQGHHSMGMVYERNGLIVGYMIYELYTQYIKLITMGVDKCCRRNGYGKIMMERLEEKLSVGNKTRIEVHVNERNLNGQLFLRRMGYKAVSIIKDAYWTDDAAYVMALNKFGAQSPPYYLVNRITQYEDADGNK